MNTLLNKMHIFANIEYKQLLIRGINQLKYEQRTFCKGKRQVQRHGSFGEVSDSDNRGYGWQRGR